LTVINRLFADRRIRFVFVGFINFVLGYGTYALLIYLKNHYLVAQLVSFTLAVTNSYFWNKYFTFKSPGKSRGEVFRFVMVYAVSYVLNMIVLYVCIDKIRLNAYIAGAFTVIISTAVSYVGHKNISFRQHK
jgi:putative flippase GtrA